jgi:zinc finger protein 830
MADIRSLLRHEQASRRITHPNLSYTKSGLLNCLVCNLIIKSETLWEGHLRSPNHKKNLLKAQNGGVEDVNGTVSKKRKISDERDDVRKRKRSTGVEQEDIQKDGVSGPEEGQKPPTDNGLNDVTGPTIPDDESSASSAAPVLPANSSAPTQPPRSEPPPPQIDEDEWAAFEREVAPLAHQNPPAQLADYSSATISAAPVSAAELAAQTNAERQQRRDAEAEDEKAEEETRLLEEFEVMEGLEERVKRLKEKREVLRMSARPGDGAREESAEERQKPPDPDQDDDDDDDDGDEADEWGFA